MQPTTIAFWEPVMGEQPLLHIVHMHRDGTKQELVVGAQTAEEIAKVIAQKPG